MRKIFLLLSLVLLIIVAWAMFREDHTTTREEVINSVKIENSKFITIGDAEIHYVDKGQGIPVLMFHGYGGSHHNWEKLINAFPEGYRLIAPDLPGFALSTFPESYQEGSSLVEMYASIITQFIDTLQLDSVYVLGNSMGGFVAWEMALRNSKVKKVVLLNALGYDTKELKPVLARIMTFPAVDFFVINKGLPKSLTLASVEKCFGDDSKIETRGVELADKFINIKGVLANTKRLVRSEQYPDTNRIAQVTQPTLIIWGDKDAIIPVDQAYKFERDIKNSKLVIYEGSGHVPMIENTEETLRDILDFFNQN